MGSCWFQCLRLLTSLWRKGSLWGQVWSFIFISWMLEVRRVCETEVPAWTRGDWWSSLLQRTTHRSGWLPHGDHPPLPSVLCCILSHIATYWHTPKLVLIGTHILVLIGTHILVSIGTHNSDWLHSMVTMLYHIPPSHIYIGVCVFCLLAHICAEGELPPR